MKRVKYLRTNEDFPPLSECKPDGLLAAGGKLNLASLKKAYSSGIFPWYSEWSPILWYSPPERCILYPDQFKLSASLRQKMRKGQFSFTIDTVFEKVINHCATTRRKHELGTWITTEMEAAYINLHKNGLAHSVEVWHENQLVGGLYGVSLGRAFFGESMFHHVSDASKAALYYLCSRLSEKGFHFIDAQMETPHLLSIGATTVTREDYMNMLRKALVHPALQQNWSDLFND